MNKIKYLLYVILIVALAILVIENPAFFMEKNALVFNLKFRLFNIPAIPTGLIILGAFVVGYFLAYVNSLYLRFQAKKMVKTINARMKVQLDELMSLRKEVEFLQRNPARKAELPKKEKEEKKAEETAVEPAANEMEQAAVQG